MRLKLSLNFSDVLASISYFSILPVPTSGSMKPPTARALTALPLVGALIGALAGIGAAFAAHFGHPSYAPAVAIVLSVILSGAIHLDGYLDSCDALIASVPPATRLTILKDPRHGTFALAGLLCLVLVWGTSLTLIRPILLPGVLAWSACTARWSTVLNAYLFPYAPGGASGGAFTERPSVVVLALIGILLCAIGATAFSRTWLGFWPIIAEGLALLLGRWASRRLGGGLVGDVYGAIICVLDVIGITVFSLYR